MNNVLLKASQTINLRHILTLQMINEQSDITQSGIAKKLKISCAAITGIYDKLEEQGYLTRETSKEDRRLRIITLTDKADKLLGQKL